MIHLIANLVNMNLDWIVTGNLHILLSEFHCNFILLTKQANKHKRPGVFLYSDYLKIVAYDYSELGILVY